LLVSGERQSSGRESIGPLAHWPASGLRRVDLECPAPRDSQTRRLAAELIREETGERIFTSSRHIVTLLIAVVRRPQSRSSACPGTRETTADDGSADRSEHLRQGARPMSGRQGVGRDCRWWARGGMLMMKVGGGGAEEGQRPRNDNTGLSSFHALTRPFPDYHCRAPLMTRRDIDTPHRTNNLLECVCVAAGPPTL
jgi:hypothetical protein